MEKHQRTKFVRSGIDVTRSAGSSGPRKSVRPLLACEFHYWQHPSIEWEAALTRIVDAGFTALTLPIPWNVHEQTPTRFRFSADLNVRAIGQMAIDANLDIIARVGPAVGAEVNRLGLPERVLSRRSCQAVTSRGTAACMPFPPRMFPLPSYAAQDFISESTGWLEAVAAELVPLVESERLLAIALDNHLGCSYRTAAFDLDYHPDALAWWDEHSGGLEAPRSWSIDNAVTCAKWVEFKEHYSSRALDWIASALSNAGLGGIATFHNAPPVAPQTVALARGGARAHSLPCFDFHGTLASIRQTQERAQYLAGQSTFAFASALAIGGPIFVPPAAAGRQCAHSIAAIGAGVRGFNVAGYTSQERWMRSSVDNSWIETLVAAANALELNELVSETPVALVSSRTDARYAEASSILGPVPSLLGGLFDLGDSGFASVGQDADAKTSARWYGAIRQALELYEIPYVLVDDLASLETLSRFRLIVCPTVRRIDAGLWERLRAVAGEDTKVIVGPSRPSVDAFESALADTRLSAGMGLLRDETLSDIDALGGDLSAAVGPLSDDWIAPDAPDVRCNLLTRPDGTAKVLVVTNQASTPDSGLHRRSKRHHPHRCFHWGHSDFERGLFANAPRARECSSFSHLTVVISQPFVGVAQPNKLLGLRNPLGLIDFE